MSEKIIVIGGTAAGLSAASAAKRLDPSLDVTVFEKSGYISYGACGLPYYIGGVVGAVNDLISLNVEQVTKERNIKTFICHEVIYIDRVKHSVIVRNLKRGDESKYLYDKLVIATGAVPILPQIPGIQSHGVYTLRNIEDGIKLREALIRVPNQNVAIVGGGFIGLEVAEELAQSGHHVHIYEALPGILSFLDAEYSQLVQDELNKHGVKVSTGHAITAIRTESGRVIGIDLDDGRECPADLIVMCIGVRPQSDLVREAGIKLSVRDTIATDNQMRTSDPMIYACGDCTHAYHIVTGKPVYIPLGTTANKQGRVAGRNIAGYKEHFPGVLGSIVTKVFDFYIAAVGLSLRQALDAGYKATICKIVKGDRASYYPGSRDTHLALIFDTENGKLLGAQALGASTVAGRINMLAACITAGMTVAQVNSIDLVYAPPVAPVYDPILIAASQAIKLVR